jgi:spoIIIJ-associated protein
MIMDNQEVDQKDQVIEEAKTVEDATQKGLESLGISREEAEIEILQEGSRGVLNLIGARMAKVMVRRKDDAAAVRTKIEELMDNVLMLMDLNCQVSVRTEDETHRIKIDSAGADGLLIGKKGQNLEALEHLMRRMVGKQLRRSVRLEVDVGGYRERRATALRNKATSMASRVKSSGREVQIEPLSAAERRIVHLTLVGDPQVKTYTVGEGDLKTVVIAPQRRNSRSAGAGERAVG